MKECSIKLDDIGTSIGLCNNTKISASLFCSFFFLYISVYSLQTKRWKITTTIDKTLDNYLRAISADVRFQDITFYDLKALDKHNSKYTT